MQKLIFKISFVFLVLISLSNCTPEESCPNCPCIESIEPLNASPGDTITIKGRNFDRFKDTTKIGTVTIGGIEANFTGVSSDTEIVIEVPSDANSGEVVVCSQNITPGRSNILCSNHEDNLCGTTLNVEIKKGFKFEIDTSDFSQNYFLYNLGRLNTIYKSCQISNGNFIIVNSINGRIIEVDFNLKIVNDFRLDLGDATVIDLVPGVSERYLILSSDGLISKYGSRSKSIEWSRFPLGSNISSGWVGQGGKLISDNEGFIFFYEVDMETIRYQRLNPLGLPEGREFTISQNDRAFFFPLTYVFASENYFHVSAYTSDEFHLEDYLFKIDKNNLSFVEKNNDPPIISYPRVYKSKILGLQGASVVSSDLSGNVINSTPFISNNKGQFIEVSTDENCYLFGDFERIKSSSTQEQKQLSDSIILHVLPTKDNRFLVLTMKKPDGFDAPDFDFSSVIDFGVNLLYTDCELSNIE